MQRYLILVFIFVASLTTFGQNGFTPAVPDKPVEFGQVGDGEAWMMGHWAGNDMTGPSSSEILCNGKEMTCTDTQRMSLSSATRSP
jgi:hypothetical protein